MWNQVVLVALIPAMMAKPILPRGDMTGLQESRESPAFDSATLRGNKMMAIAEALDMKSSNSNENETPQDEQDYEVEHRQISPDQIAELTNHAASTIFSGASAGVMSWATSVGNAMSTGHPIVPRASSGMQLKAMARSTSTPTPTPSASTSGTATASNSAQASESQSCDCIANCADEDGHANQMECIKKCSNDCDGDDDKKKNSDVLGGLTGLLGGLGGRSIPAPLPRPHRGFTHPPPAEPVHAAAGGEFEDFEACMNSCKTHNCQHSEVGLSLSQCGDTSCEDACAKYKSSKSMFGMSKLSKSIPKRRVRPVADRVKADTPLPKPKKPIAAAKHSTTFEDCMKKCQTHNCQHSEVGISISQCGDTSCTEACAQYKEEGGMIITRQLRNPGDNGGIPDVPNVPEAPEVPPTPQVPAVPEVPRTPEVPAVPAAPAVPAVKGGPIKVASPAPAPAPATPAARSHRNPVPGHMNVPVKGVAEEGDYEACMKQCKTHNCQKSGVGIDVEQCGNTSCVDACASFKHSAHAAVGVHKTKVPYAPGHLAAHPGPDPPVVKTVPEFSAHESTEYQNCVRQCKSHNCQKADIGLEVSQCGDTSCTESCAHLQEGKAMHIAGAPRAMNTAAAMMTAAAAPAISSWSVPAAA
ncbi:uncharacterized protein F4812DRAFT_454352 [Daldinia caldariorum]|uniref:uncharacterized protein n=1 Tax=Daldinia caldariorum TaxID=326644 RepID=UPI0020073F53|nr:uncharacterized protein F4812DRAFT_454352 [Daldinia caldariorum]KAI1472539.1 hypothetical protein F4812DRAFT_454352 [Daldinia caldariorum]